MSIPQFKRLLDNHPTMVKLQKLFDLAMKLGITISFNGHDTIVEDIDGGISLPLMRLRGAESDSPVDTVPYDLEYKVVFESSEYIAEQKRLEEEHRLACLEQKKKEQEERERQITEANKKHQAELDFRDHKELIRLKKKFGELPHD